MVKDQLNKTEWNQRNGYEFEDEILKLKMSIHLLLYSFCCNFVYSNRMVSMCYLASACM